MIGASGNKSEKKILWHSLVALFINIYYQLNSTITTERIGNCFSNLDRVSFAMKTFADASYWMWLFVHFVIAVNCARILPLISFLGGINTGLYRQLNAVQNYPAFVPINSPLAAPTISQSLNSQIPIYSATFPPPAPVAGIPGFPPGTQLYYQITPREQGLMRGINDIFSSVGVSVGAFAGGISRAISLVGEVLGGMGGLLGSGGGAGGFNMTP